MRPRLPSTTTTLDSWDFFAAENYEEKSKFRFSVKSNDFPHHHRHRGRRRTTTEDFADVAGRALLLFLVCLIVGKFLAPFIFPIKSHRTEEFRISRLTLFDDDDGDGDAMFRRIFVKM
jgi:hypothetical protein